MITDTKKQLTQLVEINSELANDLDVCRRKITELNRERDTLTEKVARLEEKNGARFSADCRSVNVHDTEQLRRQVMQTQRKAEEMRRERDLAIRRTDEEKERADLAEQRLHTLTMKLREVVWERNEIMTQLDESTAAMDEIRYHLASSINNPDLAREIETEC